MTSNRTRLNSLTHILVVLAALVAVGGLGACGSDSGNGSGQTNINEPTAPPTSQTTREPRESTAEPWSYGDDLALDELWDACAVGDGTACDELFDQAPAGSDYEAFGDTCGERLPGGTYCAEQDLTGDLDQDGTGQGSTETVGDVDALCSDAISALEDVPTTGYDNADFAIEEYAISDILRDLADDLASAGAADLSAAMGRFAQTRADLAVAYDQGQFNTDDEYAQVEQAAAQVEDAAASIGSTACHEVGSY